MSLAGQATWGIGFRRIGVSHYMKTVFLVAPLLLLAHAASAQSGRQDPGCARDVSRFCRVQLNDGDSAILGCLKEHRARLSKTCAKVLSDNGQ